MTIGETMLSEFDQEAIATRKTLERVPTEKFGWKPHDKSMEMGRLAIHIADLPNWTALALTSDSFDYAPPGGTGYQMPVCTTTEELVAAFDKNAATARAALADAKDEDFEKPWSLLGGGKIIFTMPKAAVVRGFGMNHLIHHRAQLGVYLRLNGIPVPGCYGPSADEG